MVTTRLILHSGHSNYKSKSWIGKCKTVLLVSIAVVFIGYGIFVLVFTVQHIGNAEDFCHSVQESNYFQFSENFTSTNQNVTSTEELETLQSNPELFYWDKCLYKVYPFTHGNHVSCQCRAMVIDWSDLSFNATERKKYFNLTQEKVLKAMLEHWHMLEKFKTTKLNTSYGDFRFYFRQSMYKSKYMKAFEWKSAPIDGFDDGIGQWKLLEYIKFEETLHEAKYLPTDFGGFAELKFLSFIENGFIELPTSICNLTSLAVLQIEFEAVLQSMPHCLGQLDNLEAVYIDGCFLLRDIPISVFNLDNVIILSIFHASITYQSVLDYNLPIDIDTNDTEAVNEWMEDNFNYHSLNQTDYYLASNPICAEDATDFPSNLQYFLLDTCEFMCDENRESQFCIPRELGNGHCDEACNVVGCHYDNGDCAQLCFAEELTNCTYDMIFNDECDQECINLYCSGYDWGSNFEPEQGHLFEHITCKYNNSDYYDKFRNINISQTCEKMSYYSPFVDRNVAWFEKGGPTCAGEWIGDGSCDDACRVDDCLNDNGDCELGCIETDCNSIYSVWQLAQQMVGGEQYKINNSIACRDVFPELEAILNVDSSVYGGCEGAVAEFDFNEDGYINFREWTAMAFDFFSTQEGKARQVNCSQCVQMEYYNI